MTERERMRQGKLYKLEKEELLRDFRRARRLTRAFNNTTEEQIEYREALLRELFGGMGERVHVEPPFRCDYGDGIFIGSDVFINFDCIFLDICDIQIGSRVYIGPRVGIYTAAHPIDAGVRGEGYEYGERITIGSNVWIGGNAIINPGVTVNDNAVVGSGAVVTKDVESGVIVAGNPATILRKITDDDKRYWKEQRAADSLE